jgi:hypothetical protein
MKYLNPLEKKLLKKKKDIRKKKVNDDFITSNISIFDNHSFLLVFHSGGLSGAKIYSSISSLNLTSFNCSNQQSSFLHTAKR